MPLERSARPLARCLRCTRHNRIPARSISTTTLRATEETTTPSADLEPLPPPPVETDALGEIPQIHRLNRFELSTRKKENQLKREYQQYPVGSRRRRAAIASSANIPFQELPYQCFQEARAVINADRAEKVAEIDELTANIAALSAQEVPPEKEALREKRIKGWTRHAERLKVLADSNDPLVKKKKFEDGFGDMRKPIYRHLSDLKWRSRKRLVLMQRIRTMNVVPDVMPAIDPTVSTALSFGKTKVAHGDMVLAAISQRAPTLEIQSYEKGKKLVTIAVVTPDVPNVEKDGFDYRCHFLAANVEIDPTRPRVELAKLSKTHSVIQGWMPPYSQKGAPYQRLAVFVLEQPSSIPVPGAAVEEGGVSVALPPKRIQTTAIEAAFETHDPSETATPPEPPSTEPSASDSTENPAPDTLASSASSTSTLGVRRPERLPITDIRQHPRYTTRDNFLLRSFATKYRLKAIGVDLFRSVWDKTTAEVMMRNGIVGHDVEFKRMRVDPLPYQRLDGGRYR